MFTGIVEEVGTVREVASDRLVVEAETVLGDAHIGDSVAVNGVCLTLVEIGESWFAVGVMPETLRRSSLGDLAPGERVNLERPVQPSGRLGGHFVQGHVDGTGTVAGVAEDGNALAVRIEAAPNLLRYVVEKGFVAVEGASLTVTGVDDTGFGVALVPHSREHLAPRLRTPGKRVNLEVDILAKYLEKLVLH